MSLKIINGEYVFVGQTRAPQTEPEQPKVAMPPSWAVRCKDWECWNNTLITNDNKYSAALWISESITKYPVTASQVLQFIEKQYGLS